MRSSGFSRAMTMIGMVLAVVVPAWAAAGRVLFDIDGTLALILGLVAAPVLMAVYLIIVWIPWVRKRHGRGDGLSNRAAVMFLMSLIAGIVFGFLSPDFGNPNAMSMLEYFAGSEYSGMAAAVANPFGIGTLFFAALALGFALRDSSGKISYVQTRATVDIDHDEDLMIPAPWLPQEDNK